LVLSFLSIGLSRKNLKIHIFMSLKEAKRFLNRHFKKHIIMSAPNFEDDHFDFPEPISTGPSSTLNTALDMTKSIVLSRPFLLALIVFLSYRLWVAPSVKFPTSLKTSENRRSSILPERVSVRKSQRPLPSIVPPVTMAKK
jgi:hypothetical protein